MDKPISVGDLVMVVRHPCCGAAIGLIFKVIDIVNVPYAKLHCGIAGCDHLFPYLGPVAYNENKTAPYCAPIAWLKRIPPLSEPEQITEEATA